MDFLVWGDEICPTFFLSFSKYFLSFPIFLLFLLPSFPLKMNHLKQICQKGMSAIATFFRPVYSQD